MKIIKGLAIFALLNALLGCFDPPDYDNTPKINFIKIEFVEVGGFSDADSLNLYIDFRDGDGDLGLATDQIDSPYHSTNFYVGEGGAKTVVSSFVRPNFNEFKYTSSGLSPSDPSYVMYSTSNPGTLVSLDNRAEYGLPPNQSPYTCTAYYQAYLYDTIFISESDKEMLTPEMIVDTLVNSSNEIAGYAALKTWYIESNPNHYNITVKFLQKQNDGSFVEFDFREAYCTTYDGRFPVLADSKRAVEGTLKYAMVGTGFLSTFSINTLKLEIQIKDRAFHEGNDGDPIETPEFTLNDIRK